MKRYIVEECIDIFTLALNDGVYSEIDNEEIRQSLEEYNSSIRDGLNHESKELEDDESTEIINNRGYILVNGEKVQQPQLLEDISIRNIKEEYFKTYLNMAIKPEDQCKFEVIDDDKYFVNVFPMVPLSLTVSLYPKFIKGERDNNERTEEDIQNFHASFRGYTMILTKTGKIIFTALVNLTPKNVDSGLGILYVLSLKEVNQRVDENIDV